MEPLFDSHAHYFDARFGDARETDALLAHLFAGEICGIVNVGTDLANSRTCIAQASKYPHMYAAVGIHPTDCYPYTDVAAAIAELKTLLGTPESRAAQKIVALGEIGFDYHYPDTDKQKQTAFFEAQLTLAEELEMPVVIHDRDAHGDCFDAVCRHPRVRGVFHSYSGSAEMARDLVRRGWYISFSGVATFKNAPRVREAIAAVPLERLLIETDAPYLAPVPYRGTRNHSGLAHYTAEAVAAVKGIETDALILATRENARKLFSLI